MREHREPRFLSVREVAARLGLGEQTVRNRIAKGAIESVRIGGRRLVYADRIA